MPYTDDSGEFGRVVLALHGTVHYAGKNCGKLNARTFCGLAWNHVVGWVPQDAATCRNCRRTVERRKRFREGRFNTQGGNA